MAILFFDGFDSEELSNWPALKDGVQYKNGRYTNVLNEERKMTEEKKVTRTKIFLDTEFTGLHKNTTLISLGLVSECGKRFYAEFTDFAEDQLDGWLKANVIANTKWLKLPSVDIEDRVAQWDNGNGYVLGKSNFVKECLEVWLSKFESVEIIADTLAYDWVLFCHIWGDAFSIPKNVFYIPTDISALLALLEDDADINRIEYTGKTSADIIASMPDDVKPFMGTGGHNALFDAEVTKLCYERLMEVRTTIFERAGLLV